MNRADLLLEVLKDGRPHSRRDIQERVGYFLTNNAASELRKRGLNVEHKRQGRVDVYRLLDEAPLPDAGGVSSSGAGTLGGEANSKSSPSTRFADLHGATQPALLGSVQLIIGEVAA